MWLRDIIKGISNFFCCVCCRSKIRIRNNDPIDSTTTHNSKTINKQQGKNSASAGDFELESMPLNSGSQDGNEEVHSAMNSHEFRSALYSTEKEFYMDRWVRGKKYYRKDQSRNLGKEKCDGQKKDKVREEMKRKVRYDPDSHRWYLRLEPLEVKEIRARHLIT